MPRDYKRALAAAMVEKRLPILNSLEVAHG